MIINLNTYVANKATIRRFIQPEMTDREMHDLVNRMVMLTMCPTIVIWYYMGEIVGFSDYIRAEIVMLKRFYLYDGVIGAPEGE
jgi:hypothetical protein